MVRMECMAEFPSSFILFTPPIFFISVSGPICIIWLQFIFLFKLYFCDESYWCFPRIETLFEASYLAFHSSHINGGYVIFFLFILILRIPQWGILHSYPAGGSQGRYMCPFTLLDRVLGSALRAKLVAKVLRSCPWQRSSPCNAPRVVLWLNLWRSGVFFRVCGNGDPEHLSQCADCLLVLDIWCILVCRWWFVVLFLSPLLPWWLLVVFVTLDASLAVQLLWIHVGFFSVYFHFVETNKFTLLFPDQCPLPAFGSQHLEHFVCGS